MRIRNAPNLAGFQAARWLLWRGVMLLRAATALSLITTALWLAEPRRAEACGGCFAAPSQTISAVESHRMVVSLSPQRSILWDQIAYSGNPSDFVWVLPVPSADATVEIADGKFFDELDLLTAPVVRPKTTPPTRPCFGCCSAGAAADGLAEPEDVTVYNEAVVGPYETVTIGSQDADALQNWLTEHGYNVDPSSLPTIMHYVHAGSVFVVLRLAPGQGVQAMQPVRVSYPGYMATFPLKMVKVGAGVQLSLSLWVFAEQRYEAYNYENALIDREFLVWDWNTGSSNYDDAFEATIQARGGRAWITEFAGNLDQLWFVNTTELERVRADIPYPYLTRLRTRTFTEYLDEDLVLVPAEDSTDVPTFITAGEDIDPPGDDDGCATGRPRAHVAMIAFVALSLWWTWRPGRRRRRRLSP